MQANNEEKHLHDLDKEIGREEKEIKELKDVLKHEEEELDHLKEEREEAEKHKHPQVIVVNTRDVEYPGKDITFRQVVKLAFVDAVFDNQTRYTVEYSKGPEQNPKGSMTDNGKSVFVKNKMVFDVERADKS